MTEARTPWDPETSFTLITSGEGDRDGCVPGEPTGEVECDCCGARAENVDRIDHDEGCPQRDVHSEWWRRQD